MTAPLDVLVCGAGPAGCSTALALRRAGVARIAVVDWPLQRPWAIGESATPDIGPMLAWLGLPDALRAHPPWQGSLSLWGGRRQVDDFRHRGRGSGWHLDRPAFDEMLRTAAVAQGVRLVRPAKVEQLAWDGQGWTVGTSDGGQWRARLLVDASGRRADLATRLGARRQRLDALVAFGVVVPQPAEGGLKGLSLVEPFEDGWWHAAPQRGANAVVCLMTDRMLARDAGLRDERRFRQAWATTQELAARLPAPAGPLGMASLPAHSGWLDRAAGAGWIAVGDALMSFDPLSASGIAGALSDGLAAADILLPWLADARAMVDAARSWTRRADAGWRSFVAQRAAHYAAETRWADRPFWSLRSAAAAVPAPPWPA